MGRRGQAHSLSPAGLVCRASKAISRLIHSDETRGDSCATVGTNSTTDHTSTPSSAMSPCSYSTMPSSQGTVTDSDQAEPPPRIVASTQTRGAEVEKGGSGGDGDGDGNAELYKKTIGSVAEEYVCPITTELPADPVVAEDGRIYERSAIEKHIRTQGDNLKSPMSNESMGPKLLPAVQVRNTIRLLIDSGVIEGQLATQWKQRMKGEAMIEETKSKAEGGDAKAMCDLGDWYFYGKNGLCEDKERSYEWYKKASDMQDPVAMANAGAMLVNGSGVQKSVANGMILTTAAAERGIDLAAYSLGVYYYYGIHDMTKDFTQAKYWLQKTVDGSCSIKYMGEQDRNKASDLLTKLSDRL